MNKKKRKKSKKKTKNIKARYIVLFVGLVAIAVCTFFHTSKQTNTDGLTYIKAQEKIEVDTEFKNKLSKKHKSELQSLVDSGQISIFTLFDDYVIYGDSRVVGFSSFGYLEDARVFASSGASILNITDWNTELATINPSNIYIAYGINDLGLEVGKMFNGGYEEGIETYVNNILSICPEAHIYINSILYADPAAMAKTKSWNNIDDYNKQLKKACKENGWTYIDNSSICTGTDESVYSGDGVHFTQSFYYTWAQNMINATSFGD